MSAAASKPLQVAPLDDPDRLLDERGVADFLRVSVHQVRKLRRTHAGPPYLKLNTNVRYRLGDLREWVRNQQRDC